MFRYLAKLTCCKLKQELCKCISKSPKFSYLTFAIKVYESKSFDKSRNNKDVSTIPVNLMVES